MTSIDRQDLAADPFRMVRGQKRHRLGNVIGPPETAHMDTAQNGLLPLGAKGQPLLFCAGV